MSKAEEQMHPIEEAGAAGQAAVDTAAAEEVQPYPTDAAEAQENKCTSAYAEGEAHARAEASAEITALKQALAKAERAAARREAEVICGRMLRERQLDEALAALILPGGEETPDEAEIIRRTDALAAAVREAAMRELRERAIGVHPGGGGEEVLTGAMLREMPLARLAELRR